MLSQSVSLVIVVDRQGCIIHVTNMSWKVVYVTKDRQLLSKHRMSKIVSSAGWRAVQSERNVVCCAVKLLIEQLTHRTMCK